MLQAQMAMTKKRKTNSNRAVVTASAVVHVPLFSGISVCFVRSTNLTPGRIRILGQKIVTLGGRVEVEYDPLTVTHIIADRSSSRAELAAVGFPGLVQQAALIGADADWISHMLKYEKRVPVQQEWRVDLNQILAEHIAREELAEQQARRQQPVLEAKQRANSIPKIRAPYDMRPYLMCQQNTARAAPKKKKVAHNEKLANAFFKASTSYAHLMHSATDKFRVMTYKKIGDALQRYPEPIVTAEDVDVFVTQTKGASKEKTGKKIKEILQTGVCAKFQKLGNSPALKVMLLLMNIHGVGQTTAARWYQAGVRTLDDLRENKFPEITLTDSQRLGLKHYEDGLQRIPRTEVSAIHQVILAGANKVKPGMIATCCGSYRRGKSSSGDVDVLLCHDDDRDLTEQAVADRQRLLALILQELGLSTDGNSTPSDAKRDPSAVITDSFSKDLGHTQSWMGYLRLPQDNLSFSGVHRRVDIKIFSRAHLAYALLYFTGSDFFNRSMRYYASKCGWALDDKGFYKNVVRSKEVKDDKLKGGYVQCWTEQEVFDAMELTYVPPHERETYNIRGLLDESEAVEVDEAAKMEEMDEMSP